MSPIAPADSFDIQNIAARYRSGDWTPAAVVQEVLRRIEAHGDRSVWISRVPRAELLEMAGRAEAQLKVGNASVLLGVPFAIKDNIDLAGQATTAACRALSSP